MINTETHEILRALRSLPPEKVDEVRDFAVFLKDKYGQTENVDVNDEWTDEDLQDLSAASFEYSDSIDGYEASK